MASFLARALGLEPIIPPPRPVPQLIGQFTTFHPCCESRVTNIHLMADDHRRDGGGTRGELLDQRHGR